jgi:hypothetical protein
MWSCNGQADRLVPSELQQGVVGLPVAWEGLCTHQQFTVHH